jgi:uncharacterized protein (DUF2141 family)
MIASLLLVSCAMKVAPTGGPRDTEAAVVIETEPRNGSTNVGAPIVRFVFDDYVDRSVRNAVTVLPVVRFQTSYAGDEIEVTFTDTLAPNTTYTVTLGTSWTDVRGNTPAQSTTIAFSTGSSLDSGVVAGKVFGASLASVTVFCYPQQQIDSASFSPRSVRPLYFQTLGTTGAFAIRGLADGRYRVIAVRDENRNTLLDGTEEYCIAPQDVVVAQGQASDLRLLLGPPLDSLGPIVQRIRALNQHVVSLQLSEQASYLDRTQPIVVSGGDRRDTAQALWLDRVPSDVAFVRFASPLDTVRYTLDVPANVFRDSLGQSSAATSALKLEDRQFRGSRFPDTASVRLAKRTPADSAQDLGVGDAVQLAFTQPMDTLAARFEAWHTSERGAHSIRLQWQDPTTLLIMPTVHRLPQTWYTSEITMRGLRALNGTALTDTVLRLAHRTQQRPADPGSVRGRLVDSLVAIEPTANLVVRFLDDKRRVVVTHKIDASRSIVLDAIPPGTYAIDVFDDRNGNGRYDHGVIAPWMPSEQWWPTSATVQVRPRWLIEDLRVVMGL